ncbi:MAG: chitobiase/beta-hexosaminidase C-terminal domain-containing protein, partial [Endomicrobiaceae bacterium]
LNSCKNKVSTNPEPVVPTPFISPAGGTYKEPLVIIMSTNLDGADIRYTLDGTDPTRFSILYTEPLFLAEFTTIRARTFYGDYIASQAVESVYNFDIPIIPQFVFVEGGTFSPNNGSYSVTLSSFYMANYEVTQVEWADVMTGNLNEIPTTPIGSWGDPGVAAWFPMFYISWFDAIVYCNRRSIQEGFMPVYAKSDGTVQ